MIQFDITAHLWLTATLLGVGAFLWLTDDFQAERYEVEQDLDYGIFNLPDPEREVSGREEYRERHAKSARYAGYAFMGLGVLSGLAVLIRLIV